MVLGRIYTSKTLKGLIVYTSKKPRLKMER